MNEKQKKLPEVKHDDGFVYRYEKYYSIIEGENIECKNYLRLVTSEYVSSKLNKN